MDDESLGSMLVGLGLDLSPITNAKNVILATMQDLNKITAQTEANAIKAATAQQAPLAGIKGAAEAAVQSALRAIAAEKQLQAEAQRHTAELKVQGQVTENKIKLGQVEIGVAKERRAALEAETAELRKQVAEIRLKRAEEEKEKKEHGEGFGAKLSSALLGKGAGGAASALLTGAGIGAAIEYGTEAIVRFVEKLKEASTEAGKLSHVWDLFEKASEGQGTTADAMLARLRDATGGLVDKLTLATYGSRVLQSGVKSLTPERIQEMTKATVELAEANGKSATEAVNTLTMAFSRGGQRAGVMLSRVTGITPAALRLANISPIANRAQRDTESLDHAISVVIAQAEKLGETPQTLEQAIERIKVHVKDLFASFGKGFNESIGSQVFIRTLQQLGGSMETLEAKAERWGDALGEGMAIALPIVLAVKDTFFSLVDLVATAVRSVLQLTGILPTEGGSTVDTIRDIGRAFLYLNVIVGATLLALRNVVEMVGALGPLFTAGGSPQELFKASMQVSLNIMSFKDKWKKSFSDFEKEASTEIFAFNDAIDQALADRNKKKKPYTGAKPGDNNTREESQTESAKTKYLKALDELEKAHAKTVLEAKQSAIADDKAADDARYRDGEESLEQHLAIERALEARSNTAKLEELKSAHDARTKELEAQSGEIKFKAHKGLITPSVAGYEQAAVVVNQDSANEAYQRELEAQEKAHNGRMRQIDIDGDKDRVAARKVAIEAEASLEEKRVAYVTELGKKAFQNGEASPDEYLASQARLIQSEATIRIDAAKAIYNATKQLNSQAKAELDKAVADATESAADKIGLLNASAAQTRLQYVSRKYGPQNQSLQGRLQLQQSNPSVAIESDENLVTQLLASLAAEQRDLEAILPKATGDAWSSAQEQLQKVYELQVKYNAELRQMQDYLHTAGTAFGALGTGVGSNFHSKFAQGLSSALSSGAKALEGADAIGQVLSRPAQRSGRGFDKTSGDPVDFSTGSDLLKSWTDKLGAAVTAIDNFTTAILGAHSAVAGGVGGAQAGAGLGKEVSSMFKLAGPWGELAGAGGGALLGAITGHKNAEVTANINKLNTSFKDINQAFAENTNNLASTITQITALMAQAQAMQASSKKGSSQYQQVIDQYIQQLNQLQVQQQQLMRTLHEKLAVLSEPVGAQSYLSDLQSILEQYQKFEGAAQSAQDLANANTFLTESLQQYSQTLSTQLLGDNTQAINDALQLNDLLYQRSQMMLDYSQQVQSLMGQGVLSRQQTRAQSTGQQVEALNLTYQRQKEQIDEQISAAQYKVTAEQQVFSLATTRVGLEAQLLVAQNAQTNLDMQRIAALASLVAQISAGTFDQGAIGALLGALQTVSNPAVGVAGNASILSVLQGLLASDPNFLASLSASAYQGRASLGYGVYRGQTT